MTDLVDFLRARLDEDEQAARVATNETGRWRWDHGLGEQCNDPECPYGVLLDEAAEAGSHAGTALMDVHGYDVKEPWQGAVHIARHDPARVLREVEAKRRIVEKYRALVEDFKHADETVVEHTRRVALEEVLEILAAPFSGEPGYKAEEWAI